MEDMKMSLDDMISTLDGAAGRLIVEAMKNPTIREAMEMISDVSISLGEYYDDFDDEE